MTTLSQRLKLARERAGLTIEQAADAMRVSETSYTNCESGLVEPYAAQLARFAKACHVGLSFFLDAKEPPAEPLVLWCRPEEGK